MVDFDWYRSFFAVYRIGTVTGAAEERGLSQPAVTQHLAALEAVVGEALFTRTPRRMVPTERGKVLYNQIVQALETLEQVSQRLPPTSGQSPLLRLGTAREYFAAVGLARLAPLQLRVWVQFGTTRALLESLQRGALDLIVATERINLRGVEYRKLAEERFILVGGAQVQPPVTQPATTEQRALLDDWLRHQTWISYGSDLPIIRRFWRESFATRPAIEPALIVPDLLIIIQAVAHGHGLSVLPAYLCQTAIQAGQLQVIWDPAQGVTNDLWLAYRALDRQRPEVVDAIAALRPTHT